LQACSKVKAEEEPREELTHRQSYSVTGISPS
jgi:hypothetical protein